MTALLTIIIGIRCPIGEPERWENLQTTLLSLHRQSVARDKYRIIVVEEDRSAHLPKECRDLADSIHFVQSHLPYNRGHVFNVGAAEARQNGDPLLCLLDADLIVPSTFVERCISGIGSRQVVLPFAGIVYLSLEASHVMATKVAQGSALTLEDCEVDVERAPKRKNAGVGGSLCITAKQYNALDGYDDRFVGWGCEDSDFFFRLERETRESIKRLPLLLLHLWHKEAERGESYENNKRLLEDKQTVAWRMDKAAERAIEAGKVADAAAAATEPGEDPPAPSGKVLFVAPDSQSDFTGEIGGWEFKRGECLVPRNQAPAAARILSRYHGCRMIS